MKITFNALKYFYSIYGMSHQTIVHVSGHAYKEDHWELLRMVKPEHIIPAHGTLEMHSAYADMAEDTGYEFGETVHILRNGQELCL